MKTCPCGRLTTAKMCRHCRDRQKQNFLIAQLAKLKRLEADNAELRRQNKNLQDAMVLWRVI
jgi:cell division protein FtsB